MAIGEQTAVKFNALLVDYLEEVCEEIYTMPVALFSCS